ncbi:MAG: hypothetical protein AAF492_00625 [Verrucomicrobiota bacterium]
MMVVLLGGLALPLIHLTHSRPVAGPEEDPPPTSNRMEVFADLRFVHEPLDFSIDQDGQRLWSKGEESGRAFSGAFSVALIKGVCELSVQAHWPEGTGETAVELTLEPSGKDARRSTLWGEVHLDDWVEFSWP